MAHQLINQLNMLKPLKTRLSIIFILVGFILLQIIPAAAFYKNERINKEVSERIKSHIHIVKYLPADHLIVTNAADMVYYFAKRNVRMLGQYTPEELIQMLSLKRKFAVFIFKNDPLAASYRKYMSSWQNPPGYIAMYSDKEVDVFIPRV